MSEQMIIGTTAGQNLNNAPLSANNIFPVGDGGGGAQYFRSMVFPVAGTIHHLKWMLLTAPGVGNARTLRRQIFVYEDTVTAEQITINSTISGTDTKGEESVVHTHVGGGDIMQLDNTETGTPAASDARYSWRFTPNEGLDDWTILCGATDNTMPADATYFASFAGVGTHVTSGANEAYAELLIPTAGTIRNLAVRANKNPGVGGTWNFTIRKNGGDTGITCEIDENVLGVFPLAVDTTNTVVVAAGDRICLKVVGAGAEAAGALMLSCVFIPDTPNLYIIPLSSTYGDTPLTAGSEFACAMKGSASWNATEADRASLTQKDSGILIISRLYARLDTALPGSGKYTFSTRVIAGSKHIAIIQGSSQSAVSGVDPYVMDEGETLGIICTGGRYLGSPPARRMTVSCLAEYRPVTVFIAGGNIPGATIP